MKKNARLIRLAPLAIGVCFGFLIAGFREYFINVVFKDPNLVIIIAGLGIFVLMLQAALFINWLFCAVLRRCPCCRKPLGTNLKILFCGFCGEKLDSRAGPHYDN